jgi:chorismate mutase
MSKGKSTERPPPRAATIPALRAKIDRLDRDLVALMNERAKLAHQIGVIKDRPAKKRCLRGWRS